MHNERLHAKALYIAQVSYYHRSATVSDTQSDTNVVRPNQRPAGLFSPRRFMAPP